MLRNRTLVYHHRNYVGTFRWNEKEKQYIGTYYNKRTKEEIECTSSNRFSCIFNWIKIVNDHIKNVKEKNYG